VSGGEPDPRPPAAPSTRAAFDSSQLRQDLRGRAVRGGAATLVAQLAKFVLIFGSTLILARLLTPEDFGLVGMIHPVTAFVWLMRDLGLSAATVQQAELEERQVNALFWINVVVSIALGGLVALLSPAVAAFYGDERLVWLTVALASTMVLGGVAAQHQALLRREMRFLEIGFIEVLGLGFGFAAAVVAAKAGLGYWALVVNLAVRETLISLMLMVRSGWRPSMPGHLRSVGGMLRFGGFFAGSKFLESSSKNVDAILIGKFWGSQSLGLYNVAYRLLLLPIQQLNGPVGMVAVPILSRLQDDPERYRRFYRQGMLLLASASTPLVLLTAAAAERMVVVLAGAQWRDSTPIFLALAPAAWIGSFNVATLWVFISTGRTGRELAMKCVTIPIIIAGIAIGARYGPVEAAIGYSIGSVLVRPFAVLWCFHGTPLRFGDLVASLARPTIAGVLAAGAAAWLSRRISAPVESVVGLAIVCGTFAIVYGGAWIALPGGVRRMRECLSLVDEFRGSRRSGGPGPAGSEDAA
jgi:O-antigen/teichoic acid export membrane protein